MAVTALIRSGLSSAEHLLLPRGLRLYGTDSALAQYGVICGMALPIVLYPMAVMNAFAQLNTADIATRVSAGEEGDSLRARISRGISFSLIYGIGCAAILRAMAYPLGLQIYGESEAGYYISALSAFAVLSYLDHITDSMLKGLDHQSFVMRINILDSAVGILCAVILVPRLGAVGYVLSLYICELLNCLCSLGKLMRVTSFTPSVTDAILIPTAVAVTAVCVIPPLLPSEMPLAATIAILALSYLLAVAVLLRFRKAGIVNHLAKN